MNCFEIGKGVCQGLYIVIYTAYLTSLQNTSWEMRYWVTSFDGLGDSQAGIKISRRNINLRYADDTILMTKIEEELKSFLMKVKVDSGKTGLKLNIKKTKLTASSSIISWQIDEDKVETIIDFISLDSKITVDGDCSHEIKRHLLLEPRQHSKKKRPHFADKDPFGLSYGFFQ